jgi:TolB-like protein/DNA-binding winged helix-turn-helix (wHTH) protein
MIYEFGEFALDTKRCELRRAGGPQHLEPQVYAVLCHLVEHRDRLVTSQELIEHVWGTRFITPGTLNSRIMALRQALDDDGSSQRVIQTVRGRGFRFAVDVLARADAAASAATTAPTVSQPKAQAMIARNAVLGGADKAVAQRAHKASGTRFAGMAVVVAVVSIAAFLMIKEAPTAQPTAGNSGSLAVLYFDNLSPDSAHAYLADGLSEEISSRLARVERLQVKSRHAVRQYRGTELSNLAEVGKTLGVTYLVDGSVRRAGDRVRASVYLVDARSGFQVWSNDYDHAASDMLSLQADIAHKVAEQIAGKLLSTEAAALAAKPTDNAEAYDSFLRGNYYLTQRSPSTVALAITEYERALRLDPTFTPALARAAYGYALYLEWGWTYPDLPPDSLLGRGTAAAERALALDSTSADAWMAHGYMLANRLPRTLTGVRAAFERAIALDSTNAEAWHQYGSMLSYLGEDSSAFVAYDKATALEPRRAGTFLLIAALHYQRRSLAEAVRALNSAIALDPFMDLAYALRALAKSRLGDQAGALDDAQAARRVAERPVFAEATFAVVEAARGDSAAARTRARALALAALRQRSVTVEEAIFLATALTAVGDRSRAIDMLEHAHPRGAHLYVDMRYVDFDPLRSDPRFQRITAEARPPDSKFASARIR